MVVQRLLTLTFALVVRNKPKMDKVQFFEKLQAQQKYTSNVCRIGAVLIVILIGLQVWEIYQQRNGIDLIIFPKYLFLVLIVIIAVTSLFLVFRNLKKKGLVCPACKSFLDLHILKKEPEQPTCKKCGESIWEE